MFCKLISWLNAISLIYCKIDCRQQSFLFFDARNIAGMKIHTLSVNIEEQLISLCMKILIAAMWKGFTYLPRNKLQEYLIMRYLKLLINS
jgi:hypothetical protein